MGSNPKSLITRLFELFAITLLICILLLVGAQVVCRYIIKMALPWTEELSRHLFIWGTFAGAVVAFFRNSHISLDSLTHRLPKARKDKLEVIVAVLTAAFSALLLFQGIDTVIAMWGDKAITMPFSLGFVFAAVPVAAGFFMWSQLKAIVQRKLWFTTCIAGVFVVLLSAALIAAGNYTLAPATLVIILICILVCLIAINTPIAIAIGIACTAYLILRHDIPLTMIPLCAISGIDSFLLLAVPLFILVGDLMNTGGITERLVTFSRALVGHIRGSLGMSTVIGEYIFSGISGSSVADVSAMGSLLIPAMTRSGYKPEMAVAIVVSASAMGMLVPPCIPMVVLASLTNLSVAALFMAGFLPAACMAILLIALIYIQARKQGIPCDTQQSARDLLTSARRAFLPLLTPVIILGGILGGIVTPTEAAMVGVVYALILGMLVYRELRLKDLWPILLNTAALAGMIMFLVGIAALLSWIFAAEGVPHMIAGLIMKFSTHPIVFLVISIIVFIVFGAILEGLPALIILTPIFFPIMNSFGLNELHYGIVIIGALGIGIFQPPFGIGFFIACAIGKVNANTAARAYLPYLAVLVVGLLLVAFVPWFTLVVPKLMHL
jgi:tripartite ATP-independent transporter DctM subunit